MFSYFPLEHLPLLFTSIHTSEKLHFYILCKEKTKRNKKKSDGGAYYIFSVSLSLTLTLSAQMDIKKLLDKRKLSHTNSAVLQHSCSIKLRLLFVLLLHLRYCCDVIVTIMPTVTDVSSIKT